MRIPRLAFAALIAGVVVLALSLAAVKVRANTGGTVALLSISAGEGKPIVCPFSIADKPGAYECGLGTRVDGQDFEYTVRMISHSDNRIEIGVRARQRPAGNEGMHHQGNDDMHDQPEQQLWFEPGETLKVENAGLPTLTVKGIWLNYKPTHAGIDTIEPGANELRIFSPLLMEDNKVVWDMGSNSGTGMGVMNSQEIGPNAISICPRHGIYLVSNSHMQDSIEAQVSGSRISFEEDGHQYVLLTGAPITRSQTVWVLHRPDLDATALGWEKNSAGTGSLRLRQTDSGTWVPAKPLG